MIKNKHIQNQLTMSKSICYAQFMPFNNIYILSFLFWILINIYFNNTYKYLLSRGCDIKSLETANTCSLLA